MPYDPDDGQPPDPPVDQEEDRPDARAIIAAHMADEAQQTEDREKAELRHKGDHNPGSLRWREGPHRG